MSLSPRPECAHAKRELILEKGKSTRPKQRRKRKEPASVAAASTEPVSGIAQDKLGTYGMPFPIVGIGASAGGLDAFTRLLQRIPADTGMAFVFVQHLSPQHPSMLASLLSRLTAMPVREVDSETPVEPNHVYVIQPNTLLSVDQGVLRVELRPEGVPRPIDCFFRSLAVDRKSLAIGIVLSGADSDGAMGLQAIRAEGGIAIVQSEGSAKYGQMPSAAIRAGTVDLILPPEQIGAELSGISQYAGQIDHGVEDGRGIDATEDEQLKKLFGLLRRSSGIDFSGYRRGTLIRRIKRRMMISHSDDLASYVSSVESNPSEIAALADDLLINVTSFFREPTSFLTLQNEILPVLLKDRAVDSPLRLWVPGCSSGQEVYSLAMCCVEAMATLPAAIPVQIFGTDLSERCIGTARAATYSESETAGFSPQMLDRFFKRVDKGYQIVQAIREMCVFARHNLFVDPPYSRLDLICCRNVLIYVEASLQRQVIATFHYALRPNGYLMLGPAEGLRDLADLFTVVNKDDKLYRRKADRTPLSLELVGRGVSQHQAKSANTMSSLAQPSPAGELHKVAQRIVLSTYAPVWVIVSANLEVLHSQGDIAPYLQLPAGRASLSLLKMAREGIRPQLRAVMTRMKSEALSFEAVDVVQGEARNAHGIRIEVRRIGEPGSARPSFLVVFLPMRQQDGANEGQAERPNDKESAVAGASTDLSRLREELAATTERLEAIISERDAANEDLTSANEEIRSSNEELQSINEELETSKEELQSSNEELNTVNEELENRNRELNRLSDDLANLLSSTTIPIVMLDADLRIRRFTPAAGALLHCRPSDIGRPFGDIRTRLSVDDLDPIMHKVLDTLVPKEIELQDSEGRWHLLRVRPYRTADNRIEGAVLALIDIDQLRRAELAATAAREFSESVIESLRTPLVVLRSDLCVRVANGAFYDCYGLKPADVQDRPLHGIPRGQWSADGPKAALERLSSGASMSEHFEGEHNFPALGRRAVAISARRVETAGDTQIVIAIQDITVHKEAERILFEEQGRLQQTVQVGAEELKRVALNLETESLSRSHAEAALEETEGALRRSREELRALTASLLNTQEEERRRVSRELHDDLSQKMAKLQFDVETLEQKLPAADGDLKARLLTIRDQAGTVANDVRRIAYRLHPSALEHLGLSVALRSFVREFAEREGVEARFEARRVPKNIAPDIATSVYRIAQEALRNVAKHAGDTAVDVILKGESNEVRLTVRDHGVGFNATAVQGGGGLGLISMQERARLIGGDFLLNTRPGSGVEITVRVPLT